jgi:hypothetical protein
MGYRSSCDGVAKKGKTKGTMMAGGGMVAMKKGGTAKESMMEKKMGKGMAKAKMQKVAKAEVKGHESRMHKGKKKMAAGGMPMATKAVKMRQGGSC